MVEKNVLAAARARMAQLGHSEFVAKEDFPALQQMWGQLQELRTEMNEAKKAAAAEAAKPYLEMIDQIERKYAVMLKLMA